MTLCTKKKKSLWKLLEQISELNKFTGYDTKYKIQLVFLYTKLGSPVPDQHFCVICQAQILAVTKDLLSRPHGEVPFPHQTWGSACTSQCLGDLLQELRPLGQLCSHAYLNLQPWHPYFGAFLSGDFLRCLC